MSTLLLDKPGLGSLGGPGGGGIDRGALDFDSHRLILLKRAGKVGLLGGGGGLGEVESLDVALGVGVLDRGRLVGLELLEVELLDEIGCAKKE